MRTGKEILEDVKRDVEEMSEWGLMRRYTKWTKGIVIYEDDERCTVFSERILNIMKQHRMNFNEACIVLGYVRKLLRIGDEYINGIDLESEYIRHCLKDELIDLSKNIADYIETQEEVYVHIPTALEEIYRILVTKSKEVILW